MPQRFEVQTARLTLVGADETLLRAELDSPEALGTTIDARVPVEWPPEHHDRGVPELVAPSRTALSLPGADEVSGPRRRSP